jgi:1,4-dihydroxy-6-naphthoate synthase
MINSSDKHPLTLGFSPCPNDTFMFDAMIHHKIDTEGLSFEVVMEDVESLNQRALREELDVTKISFAAFLKVTKKYVLLNSGSALGKGVGPILISKEKISDSPESVSKLKVALPGENTTANFLFSIFYPQAKNKIKMIFSEIEDAVLSGKTDAGVIIHENRFTYELRGLKKICDLGERWENETNQPVPLGGIAVKRNLDLEIQEKLNRVLKKSIEFAFANPQSSSTYVAQHAQEMSEEVRMKHIQLYVNEYSVDLGTSGKIAIDTMIHKAISAGMIEETEKNIFLSHAMKADVS